MSAHRWTRDAARIVAIAGLAMLWGVEAVQAQQDSVGGRVISAATHTGLVDVQVVARDSTGRVLARAQSGGDGSFVLRGLLPGARRISANRVGYVSASRDIEPRADYGASNDVVITMTPLPTQLDAVVVSATRTQDAEIAVPADVQEVTAAQMAARPTVTPTEQLRWVPGVDYAGNGLMQANVTARGFNNIFSSSMLTLTDYRYAFLPSLHLNSPWVMSAPGEDVERLEVLLGPAAALYGPNTANGVIHTITKSPWDLQGTTLSISAGGHAGNVTGPGEGLWRAAVRHAGVIGSRFGYKITGQYFSGQGWQERDSAEVQARRAAIAGGARPDTLRIGQRDFASRRWAVALRADYRPTDSGVLTLEGGRTRAGSLIELTPLGASQVQGWDYDYYQARYRDGRFFAQAFLNSSDAGGTFLLRTGAPIVDKSLMYAVQVQHGLGIGHREVLTYGVDWQRTDPRTGGTVNGRNENDDDLMELGGYVHSETRLAPDWELFSAARVDKSNRLGHATFSPRLALVFHPSRTQSLRLTWNRAFNSPSTTNLFLDILAGRLGPLPFDIRAVGMPVDGLPFRRDAAGGVGGLYMRSPFAPDSRAALPADATAMWGAVVQLMKAQGVDLSAIPAPGPADVRTILRTLDPASGTFANVAAADVRDLAPLKENGTNTIELGYKGFLGDRVQITADVYRERKENFVSALTIETPNVFLDPTQLGAYLGKFMPAAQAQTLAAAIGGIPGSSKATGIPVGTVSPEGTIAGSSDVLLTFRNFGRLTRWGSDVGIDAKLFDPVSLLATYSWTNKNLFPMSEVGGFADIALNAPANTGSVGLRYGNESTDFTAEAVVRLVGGFPMQSGDYVGNVSSYAVTDASIAYRVRPQNMTFSLSAQNVFNNLHREFVGAPTLGRLLYLQARYTF
ncbi:MAG TPA: TonB-dependent receptor [Gemmatimonadaceae bacterium]|nr:TonB-dependent receptor [Gemmatimonadaceae bacterium]